jgi:hypothetical protein
MCQQELTTCAKKCGQEEEGKFCKEGVTSTCVGEAGNRWLPTGLGRLTTNRRPVIKCWSLLGDQPPAVGPPAIG